LLESSIVDSLIVMFPTSIPLLLPGLFLITLWGVLCEQLSFEWWHNAQYNYALFLPFIALWLGFVRWSDRPPAVPVYSKQVKSIAISCLVLVILLHFPLRVVFQSNTDWRLLLWIQGLLDLLLTCTVIYLIGGRSWLNHFFYPVCLLLFAIPWPKFIELAMIQCLLKFVAYVTVECLNLVGIFSIQKGNIIHLSSGTLYMEDACSGVRSFQSLVMFGFVLGEVFRLSTVRRMCLVCLGALLALIFNIGRTLFLGMLAHLKGSDLTLKWHDSTGYVVLIISLVCLYGIAYRLSARVPQMQKTKILMNSNAPQAFYVNSWIWVGSMGVLVLACIFPYFWYGSDAAGDRNSHVWNINWDALQEPVTFLELSHAIEETLCHPKAVLANYHTEKGQEWLIYFFKWHSIKAAQLAGVHSPDLCLTTRGWNLNQAESQLKIWKKDDIILFFNAYTFQSEERLIHIFYCQWDTSGYPFYKNNVRAHKDRFQDALNGIIKKGQRSIEVIISGHASLEAAWTDMEAFLDQTLVVQSLEADRS
jgi:exosortase